MGFIGQKLRREKSGKKDMSGDRWFHRRKLEDICGGNLRKFSYASLLVTTNNLSRDMILGMGGFETVYKGVLSSGTIVAVKIHSSSSDQSLKEFVNEVEVMSYIRHRNISRLIGYCEENGHLSLVYDYYVNGSLYELLRDPRRKESPGVYWDTRAAICTGIARGLCYLHEDVILHVIHCDIKPSNILLDANFIPKISDFGIARHFDHSERELPHQTDCTAGTYGYMDSSYAVRGQFSEKTDVFAFGVVMLGIISGRLAIDESRRHLAGWASKLAKNDRFMEIVDPVLIQYPMDAMEGFINVALLCVQRQPNLRPSMQEVSHWLHQLCNSIPCWVSLKRPDISLLEIDFENYARSPSACVDSNSEVIDQGEPDDNSAENEQIEPCTSRARGGQDNTQELSNGATVSQTRLFPRNTKNNNNVCPEAVYPPFQTRVFTHNTTKNNINNSNVFPEAVYPPFRTRVFRRLGSRNLYTCDFESRAPSQDDILARRSQKANVCPEAVYPPFQTGTFRRHGSRNLYTFSTMHSVS